MKVSWSPICWFLEEILPWKNEIKEISTVSGLYTSPLSGELFTIHRGNAIVEMLPDLFIPVQNLTNQAKEPFSPKHNELLAQRKPFQSKPVDHAEQ